MVDNNNFIFYQSENIQEYRLKRDYFGNIKCVERKPNTLYGK